jgi:hypothetical protein
MPQKISLAAIVTNGASGIMRPFALGFGIRSIEFETNCTQLQPRLAMCRFDLQASLSPVSDTRFCLINPLANFNVMSAPKKPAAAVAHPKEKNDEGKSAGKGGLVGKLMVGAFVSAIVVTETFVFFFLVPSGEEVAALAEARLIAAAQEIDASQHESGENEDRIVEFDLGTYSVSFIPPDADHNYRVEFRLFGTLHAKDEERLTTLFNERQGRFRHRMLLEIRNTTIKELDENQLGLIQRRVLATSTELLGEAVLLSVGFQEYQVLED